VAVLGVAGQEGLIAQAADFLRSAGAPSETVNAVTSALESGQKARGTAWTALLLGLATSIYGASGAFGACGRALNRIWRVDEGRSFVKHKIHNLLWTATLLVLVLTVFVLVFLGGALADFVFGQIGIRNSTFASVWVYARWPLALGAAILIYAIIYFAAPNVEIRRFQWITPGAVFGVFTWLLASVVFFIYVSNFSSYSATYGAFAGAVILLVWLWLTNVVLLFGAELNAVIDLRRSPHLPESYDGPPLPAKEPADA
jgi:membrane protein